MIAVINNKTYSSVITIKEGKVTRSDARGSVIENNFHHLATALEVCSPDETIYVSRFLYKTLVDKDYEYWLGGSFKNGILLTPKEMSALMRFTMAMTDTVKFENIDKYTLKDVPQLEPKLGLLVTEVVSARTQWNSHQVKENEVSIIEAPEDAIPVESEKTQNLLIGLSINNTPEKKEEKIMPDTITLNVDAPVSAPVGQPVSPTYTKESVFNSIEEDEELEMEVKKKISAPSVAPSVSASTVTIDLSEPTKPVKEVNDEMPPTITLNLSEEAPAKKMDKPIIKDEVIRIELESGRTTLIDPMEDYLLTGPPATVTLDLTSPTASGRPIAFGRAKSPAPAPSASKVSISNKMIELALSRKAASQK